MGVGEDGGVAVAFAAEFGKLAAWTLRATIITITIDIKFIPLLSRAFLTDATLNCQENIATIRSAKDSGRDLILAMTFKAVLRIGALLITSFALEAFASAPRAVTPYGEIEGLESDTTFAYLGIPYAASPAGQNRFKPPVSPTPWPKPLPAKKFGPVCPQSDLSTKKVKGQEDCLSLNIWRPKAITRALPVMVFIHGGGNTIGSSADEVLGQKLYDGKKLAEEGNVVVSLNYRLGTLGFLAHPSLKTPEGLEGNYAILDQLFALKFVKNSVSNFGGDPNNITVFGESAGAINTLVLLASPLAQGLFQRAIVESGFITELPLTVAETQGLTFASNAGCPNSTDAAACLRNLPTEKILETANKNSSALLGVGSPTIDGYVLKAGIVDSISSGSFNKVPTIIGTNRDEFRTLLPAVVDTGSIFTSDDYEKVLINHFGREKAEEILAEYPASHHPSPKRALEEVLNDSMAHCPARSISRALVAAGTPTYRYVFTHTGDNAIYWPYGAGHALELPFVFGMMGFDRSFREHRFSREIRSYWSAFAATGNPRVKGQALWPSAQAEVYLDLAPSSEAKAGFRTERCDFWDELAK